MAHLTLVSDNYGNSRVAIIDQINMYANRLGLTKKAGAYFKDGRFYGSIFDLGKEAGIDMQEYR